MITYVREAGIGLELVIPLKTAPLERKEKKEKTATVEERNEATRDIDIFCFLPRQENRILVFCHFSGQL